jgi:hypothetical protein
MFNRALHVKRVPIDDGGDHQIEAGRPVATKAWCR